MIQRVKFFHASTDSALEEKVNAFANRVHIETISYSYASGSHFCCVLYGEVKKRDSEALKRRAKK